ncbi:MAG: DNA (cytosine-5-)-methyltransferase [Acidobacteria bacterium]|nr:DNA (cytosine-5-)-methyltransferase [Acidobacteriota bacterium]
MTQRPRFLEFFAGAGLVRLALEPAWRCVWANDVSPHKASVYRANFGDGEFLLDDVAAVEADALPDAELAWASFPCQDLSLAGWRRGLGASRSGTFWAFWGLMRRMRDADRRPPLIVLENVVGLLHGADFSGLCEALAALDLRFGALVINAERFVPQSRPRVFVVACPAELQSPPPLVQSAPGGLWHPASLVRAADALPQALQDRWLWWRLPEPSEPPPAVEVLIEADPPEDAWLARDEAMRLQAMMAAPSREKLRRAREEGRRYGFLYRRTRQGRQRAEVRFDGVAGCLRTPAGGSSRQTLLSLDGEQVRMRLLTAREAARLMGVPDAFVLPTAYNQAYHAMGDGVAVPVVQWLGEQLLRPLLDAGHSLGSFTR